LASERARLAVLFLVMVINVLGIGLMLPVVPILVRELAGGEIAWASVVYGGLIALYSLMQFLFGPAMGALSDRFGRRPIILSSLAGLGLDYLLLAIAPNLWVLALARIVGGVMGASLATANAYIADITPPSRRAQNFGLMGVAFGVGFVAGPLIGGLLATYGSRVPFYAAAGACAAGFIVAWFLLPESLSRENRRQFRLREANPLGAFLLLRRHRVVVAVIAVFALSQFAERMLEATWVLFTTYQYSWSVAEVGLSLAFVGALFIVSQGLLVRIAVPRFGEEAVVTFGMVAGVICFVLFAFAVRPWMMYVVLVPYILIWGLVGPSLQAVVTRSVNADEQGTLQGVITATMTATGVFAPPVGGALFGFAIGPEAPIHFPGLAFLAGSVLFLAGLIVLLRRRPVLFPRPATG
jgi:MFS transporter, DHA1 family, tetracycline resistance protein